MSLGQTVGTYFLLPGLLLPLISFLLYKVLRENSQIEMFIFIIDKVKSLYKPNSNHILVGFWVIGR